MAQQNIKQIIKQEYIKCAKDPVYFMKKYCMIQHPTRGRIKFNLYPFQEGVLNLLNKNERNIILKSKSSYKAFTSVVFPTLIVPHKPIFIF